jgi:hypothetical protein
MENIKKYKNILTVVIFINIIFLSILIRIKGIPFITGDMIDFENWFYELKNNRRITSIKR